MKKSKVPATGKKTPATALKKKKKAKPKTKVAKAMQLRRARLEQVTKAALALAQLKKWKAASLPRTAHIRIETHRNLFAVEILDADSRRMARSYGELRLDLPPGRYIARCEVGGPTVDKVVEAKAGEESVVVFGREEIYKMPSAAPVSGSISRHEFFTYPASELAKAEPDVTMGSGSRLVLFASRFEMALQPSFPATKPLSLEEIRLLDGTGREILSFPDASSRKQEDVYYGRAGAAVDLNPGGYYLRWPASEGRADFQMQPVWLAPGWTTFVFASALGNSATPRSETASIHMARLDEEVSPYDEETTAINAAAELALASLRTGRRQFGDHALDRLIGAKFKNPMLGILGCYVILGEEERNEALLDALTGHLRELVGDHPDVRAIDLLRQETPREAGAFAFPPMLAQGLLGLDHLEWSQSTQARATAAPLLMGTARLARLRALADSPWTTFWHGTETSTDIRPGSDISAIPKWTAPLIDLRQLQRMAAIRPESIYRFELPSSQSPFERAEIQAIQEANASLTHYIAQLRLPAGALTERSLRPQHLSWAGLAPTTAYLVASADVVDPIQFSNRFDPL